MFFTVFSRRVPFLQTKITRNKICIYFIQIIQVRISITSHWNKLQIWLITVGNESLIFSTESQFFLSMENVFRILCTFAFRSRFGHTPRRPVPYTLFSALRPVPASRPWRSCPWRFCTWSHAAPRPGASNVVPRVKDRYFSARYWSCMPQNPLELR